MKYRVIDVRAAAAKAIMDARPQIRDFVGAQEGHGWEVIVAAKKHALSLMPTSFQDDPEAAELYAEQYGFMADTDVKAFVASKRASARKGMPSVQIHQIRASHVYDDDDHPTSY